VLRIARFLGIDQKCNQVVPWSLHTFPENFMEIGPTVSPNLADKETKNETQKSIANKNNTRPRYYRGRGKKSRFFGFKRNVFSKYGAHSSVRKWRRRSAIEDDRKRKFWTSGNSSSQKESSTDRIAYLKTMLIKRV